MYTKTLFRALAQVGICLSALWLSSCSNNTSSNALRLEEEKVLMQSSFFPGELNPQAEQTMAVAYATAGSDGGTIAPPPGYGGNGDTGTIPAPGTSTGTSSGSSTTSGSTSSGTTSGSTTTQGTTSGSGTTTSGTSSGTTTDSSSGTTSGSVSTSTGSTGGSDGGVIVGGNTSGGGDSGTIGGSTGGSGSDTGSTGGSTSGTAGGTSGGTIPGGTNPDGSTASTGGTGGGTSTDPAGGTSGSGSTSNDGGTVAGGTNGGTTGGTDGGSLGGQNTSPGTNDGGSTVGGTSPGSTGSGSTPTDSTNPPSGSGGTVVDNSNPPGTSGGTTNPTDGGTVAGNPPPGGSSSSDGGSVGGSTPGGTNPNDGGSVAGNNPPGGTTGGTSGGTTPDNSGPVVGSNPPGGSTGGTSGGTTTPGGSTGGTTPNDGGSVAGNNPPAGTNPNDGGTLPGSGTNPPGGDGGTTIPVTPPVVVDGMDVRLNRVCSVRRSKIPYPMFVFFEDAKRPILTFESLLDTRRKACVSVRFYQPTRPSQQHLAAMGLDSLMDRVDRTESQLLRLIFDKVDLSKVDLIADRFRTKVQLGMEQAKSIFPTSWKKIYLQAMVCDDTTRDGSCLDEPTNRQLSVYNTGVQLGKLPKLLDVYVWSGRNLTLASDPESCEEQHSPLVLDMEGNGFKLSGPEHGMLFDINDSGEQLLTGWVIGRDDALLVRDINNNGEIDSGAELFGSATRLKTGQRAANGFAALADMDSNGDGVVSSADEEWNNLRLWFDANFNGRAEARELRGLSQMQVESIRVDYVDMMEVDQYGNQTRQRSTFRRTVRGVSTARMVIDVWFNTLTAR